MSILERHNVKVSGRGERAMMFAPGFGCDQNMWRFVAPSFEERFRVVLFDHVGAGGWIGRRTKRCDAAEETSGEPGPAPHP